MSLRTKLVLPFLLLLTTIAILLHGYLFPKLHDALNDGFRQANTVDIHGLGASVAQHLLTQDLAELYSSLDAHHALRPDWLQLSVSNGEGLRLYPLAVDEAETDSERHQDLHHLHHTIIDQGWSLVN